jgi:transcription termination factor NusB
MAVSPKQREQRALIAGRHKARHFAVQALYQWDMADNLLSDIEQHFRGFIGASGQFRHVWVLDFEPAADASFLMAWQAADNGLYPAPGAVYQGNAIN